MEHIENRAVSRPAPEILAFVEALARQLAREDNEAALAAQIIKRSAS